MAYLLKGHKVFTEQDLYPAPPLPKEHQHDPRWGRQWLRTASRLWFLKGPQLATFLATGETVTVLGWRRAHWGPALRIEFGDGRIETGYDPTTVRFQ